MSFRGFTYALRPKPEQIAQMAQFAGVCRLVWNLALKQRQDHWRHYTTKTGKQLNHVARFEKVSPSYSSQTCSSCGTVDKRSRESQAVFVCSTCGYADNADRNAAAVILSRGNTPGVEDAGCGSDEARTGRVAA